MPRRRATDSTATRVDLFFCCCVVRVVHWSGWSRGSKKRRKQLKTCFRCLIKDYMSKERRSRLLFVSGRVSIWFIFVVLIVESLFTHNHHISMEIGLNGVFYRFFSALSLFGFLLWRRLLLADQANLNEDEFFNGIPRKRSPCAWSESNFSARGLVTHSHTNQAAARRFDD